MPDSIIPAQRDSCRPLPCLELHTFLMYLQSKLCHKWLIQCNKGIYILSTCWDKNCVQSSKRGKKSRGKHRKMCVCTYPNTYMKNRKKLFQNSKQTRNAVIWKLYKKRPTEIQSCNKNSLEYILNFIEFPKLVHCCCSLHLATKGKTI